MNIIITGGSRGIGRSVAMRFAREGWDIALCARDKDALARTREVLLQLNPAITVMTASADLGTKDAVLDFAEKVKAVFPVPDVLVNNAGIFIPGAVHEEADGVLETTMAVNLYSAYHLTRALLPAMKTAGRGHIINLCSTASLRAYPNGGAYSISKFALLGFSRNLREELKPHNIKVTAVCPGPTLTDSWAGYEGPPERLMPPEDVAEAIWMTCNLASQTVVEDIVLRPLPGDLG
ncbi:SDR family oxidoreductase [Compostibacter hankyongensis]|uniref:SDR family oxidoreductase n=1 Tax=Compostibacter hankyongensis TaxID=1007089 RepID=A0ABP8G0L4_9BACT